MHSDAAYGPLSEAYELLHASSPSELVRKFIEEDQRLIKAQEWDCMNPELVLNKVKEIVESVIDSGSTLGDKDGDNDLKTMLWFWYHHAIGYAIWDHKDRKSAVEFSTKALKYQTSDNPNQITRLLYFLTRDQVAEATALLEVMNNDQDKSTARGIMNEYLAGNFYK